MTIAISWIHGSKPMARLNTSLQATGAEFLVLGHLLINGIEAYKSYVNHPGYDLVAVHPDANQSCRIQVKSRFASDFDGGFPIKSFDCDVVVFVALNRGYRYRKAQQSIQSDLGIKAPDFYVFPVAVIQAAVRVSSTWQKVNLKDIVEVESYRNNWQLIR